MVANSILRDTLLCPSAVGLALQKWRAIPYER
jgi:hypothetical protein